MRANVPLAEEIAYADPIMHLADLATFPYVVLLDSASVGDARGRFSYLCVSPVDRLVVPPDALWDGGRTPSAFDWLKQRLGAWHQSRRPDLPPFQGGAAGLLGYELGGWLESLPRPAGAGSPHPVAALGIYDVVVAFDHAERRAWIVSTGYPEAEPQNRADRARRRLDDMRRRLTPPPLLPLPDPVDLAWVSDVGRADYMGKVQRAIDYIHAGDVFQINLSRELCAARPAGVSPLALYRDMRERTRAPFSAYMALEDGMAVCSFSPERFLQAGPDGLVETRPIKGTRPRGRDPATDRQLAAELTASPKDRAENLMIVDLLRNDLGRVCEVGSIAVPQLCGLESFGAVHHLVSVVTGQLRADRHAVDLLAASFPGGSITGAPKIRAIEIINELEARRRGPYCGSLCWLGFDGSMDSSILIRTMVVDRDHVRYGVGGGIVADSDPQAEWLETEVKAAAFVNASGQRQRDAVPS